MEYEAKMVTSTITGPWKRKQKRKVLPRFELGSQDSESWVLTVTPWNPVILIPGFAPSPGQLWWNILNSSCSKNVHVHEVKVLPRLELGSLDSKSKVLTIAPQNPIYPSEGCVVFSFSFFFNSNEKFLRWNIQNMYKINNNKGCAPVFFINMLSTIIPLTGWERHVTNDNVITKGHCTHVLLSLRFHRDLNSDRRIQSPEC